MAKTLELYFYSDGCDTRVTNKQPVLNGGSIGDADESVGMELCADGQKVFGVPELNEFQIVRMRLAVETMEIGEYEIAATFKEFAPAKRRTRKA
jgi:hypothetical protein